MEEQILLKSKLIMNAHLCNVPEQEAELKEDVGSAPGSRDGVGAEGPTEGSALGTGIQATGCGGWEMYGARMSPGLVVMPGRCEGL